ncbi:MAG: YkgJ family cysteine cluster protein [Desulfobacterales bacterium]|nr:YkgJ family cysteine cluster protein [Desulfobacterales bacterium]
MSDEPRYIGKRERFTFSCGPEKACFNQCCCDINQFLFPYDILRLSRALGMTTDAFLAKYTYIYAGDTTGLPVVSFLTSGKDNHACPLLSKEGCRVYKDRPASCRMFPLARALARSREDGAITEHFALIEDPICEGFSSGGATTTPARWMEDQGLKEYNRRNDQMIELISLKQQILPGRLEGDEKEAFVLACYNLDGFREKVKAGDIEVEEKEAVVESDEALMDAALAWVKARLFGR